METSLDDLNGSQRVVLLAEGFEYSVLIAAEWLSEEYGVDIRCYRVELSHTESEEFISCTCIYPARELAEHAERRGRRKNVARKWQNWKEVISQIDNPAVAEFYQSQIDMDREANLPDRELYFRLDGKRRLNISARRKFAYAWQNGRFEDDIEYWRAQLGDHANAGEVMAGAMLRFYLASEEDFSTFVKLLDTDLKDKVFV